LPARMNFWILASIFVAVQRCSVVRAMRRLAPAAEAIGAMPRVPGLR
jgi:hypothetical protein